MPCFEPGIARSSKNFEIFFAIRLDEHYTHERMNGRLKVPDRYSRHFMPASDPRN